MVIKRRIETTRAEALRNKRQDFAVPGGAHDKLVGFLARALPMGVGLIAAFMVITPLSPRGEVSFLLDRNAVSVIEQRLSVDNAMYRGRDNLGRPFSITAGEAVQRSSVEGKVRMDDLLAQLLLDDGPAQFSAAGGVYDINSEVVDVDGTMRVRTADGYAVEASGVQFNLETRTMSGSDGVEGALPVGTFSAKSMRGDLDARTISLDGNARLTMVPGKLNSRLNSELRMP